MVRGDTNQGLEKKGIPLYVLFFKRSTLTKKLSKSK